MVWIHGGSWSMGSGNGMTDIHGPDYFLDRDIVLVTINYRLGPLGWINKMIRLKNIFQNFYLYARFFNHGRC